MDRKKELKLRYKLEKPKMGIFIIHSKINNKCYLQATPDLRGVMNGAIARLKGGSHPYRELQKEWEDFGADSFTMEILEELAYGQDETKTDYSEELALLKMIWEEKLARENRSFYRKKI